MTSHNDDEKPKGITVMFPFFKHKNRANTLGQSSLTLFSVFIFSVYSPNSYSHYTAPHYSDITYSPIHDPGRICPIVYWGSSHPHLLVPYINDLSRCYYKHSETLDCSGGVNDNNAEFCTTPLPLPDINNGDDGCNASSPSNLTDYPINIATGNKYFTNRYLNDVGIVGIDPIRLDLFYNSNTDSQIWTHTYSRSLIIEADSIKSKRANGQVFVFANNQGVIVGLPRRLEKLVKIVNSIDNHPALAVYKLSLPNKTVELYNESGQLLSIDYPSGIRHKLIYSTSSSRVYVWHQSDSSATDFNYIVSLYISDNKITRATYNRTTIAFHYDQVDGIDRLLTATYAGGGTKTYLYENTIFPHYITGILDENGNRISSVQYDDQGRAISSEMGELGSGIERSQITYHEDGTRTVTNALGKQNIYHFTQFNSEYKMTQVEGQASTNCASANQAYTYDTNGFMASKTDWKGNVTTYIHNNRGQELSRTEASGTPEVRTIVTEWHVTFNLPTKIIEPERETLFSYDSDGRLTSKEINPR